MTRPHNLVSLLAFVTQRVGLLGLARFAVGRFPWCSISPRISEITFSHLLRTRQRRYWCRVASLQLSWLNQLRILCFRLHLALNRSVLVDRFKVVGNTLSFGWLLLGVVSSHSISADLDLIWSLLHLDARARSPILVNLNVALEVRITVLSFRRDSIAHYFTASWGLIKDTSELPIPFRRLLWELLRVRTYSIRCSPNILALVVGVLWLFFESLILVKHFNCALITW